MSQNSPTIGWMGAIPANWKITRAGHHLTQVKNKNEGMKETNLLSLSYGKIKRRDINATDGLLPESFEGYNIIQEGDIVLRFTDLQNDHTSFRVGRATEDGIITSAYVTVRPTHFEDSEFLYYALHAYDLRKGFYGMGSGVRQGLKWQEAKYIQLPWPPQEIRSAIVDYLNQSCASIDAALLSASGKVDVVFQPNASIADDLKAFKQSLIYEVVTGKREV